MRIFIATFASVVILAICGCRSVEALKRDCTRGDRSACEAACSEGVAGEGGCFSAAESFRRAAGLDYESKAHQSALSFHRRSCAGGYADGCLFSAQMIEAPYASVDGKAVPPAMGDEQIVEREQFLKKACERESKAACKRLGDVLIGKNGERALAAYEKACRFGKSEAECIVARRHEVQAFDRYGAGCKKQVADDCTMLGNLLFRVDMPRAVRLFIAEHGLRGIEKYAGPVEQFVLERVRDAQAAKIPDPTAGRPPRGKKAPPLDADAAGLPKLSWAPPTIEGRLARPTVERVLRLAEPALKSCARGRAANGTVKVELIVDRTGDVWRARASGPLPEAVDACVRQTLSETRAMMPVAGAASVTLELRFQTS